MKFIPKQVFKHFYESLILPKIHEANEREPDINGVPIDICLDDTDNAMVQFYQFFSIGNALKFNILQYFYQIR